MDTKVIPVLRIFDYDKTVEFYIDWLGFNIDWKHRFNDDSPLYMQVSKGPVIFHLTEHHGDCCPGSKVYVETTGVRDYHKELIGKKYKYNRPGIEQAPWNAPCVTVNDPFGNTIMFTEKGKN